MYVGSLSKYLHDFKRPVEHAALKLTLESELISFSNSAKCNRAIHIVCVLLPLDHHQMQGSLAVPSFMGP